MQNSIVKWILSRIKKRIPAMVLMILTGIVNATLGVTFALGTKGVIDGATSGDRNRFLVACLVQLAIIAGILLSLTLMCHMTERLTMDLERDWKRQLLSGLLHGDYAGVSSYHSGELLNRLNNDVRILDTGIVNILPNLAAMITKLVAAVLVLIAMEPMFTLVVLAAGVAVILVTSVVRKNLKTLNKKVSESEGRVSGFIQETLEKLLMVQAMDVFLRWSAARMYIWRSVTRSSGSGRMYPCLPTPLCLYWHTVPALVRWCSAVVACWLARWALAN